MSAMRAVAAAALAVMIMAWSLCRAAGFEDPPGWEL